MSGEVRVMAEGTLRAVQASGAGLTWVTASGATTWTIGYCRSFTYTSGQTVMTIKDRGIPAHNKVTEKSEVSITFQFDYNATGSVPVPASGGGATVPMFLLEHKQAALELGSDSGVWHLFMGCPGESFQFTEGDPNTLQVTTRALAMLVTGSGYLNA